MVFTGLASKPMATVSSGLASKPAAMVFSSLASKLVAMVSPGLASKPAVGFLVEPQNQGDGGFSGLGLKISSSGLMIWTPKSTAPCFQSRSGDLFFPCSWLRQDAVPSSVGCESMRQRFPVVFLRFHSVRSAPVACQLASCSQIAVHPRSWSG
jgi:hypothetical protein